MFNGRRILGLIPARGGSKGVPGKNIVDLGGNPLIAWTVEAGLHCGHIDRLLVSTDAADIAEAAATAGAEVPFMRPADLAADDTPTIDVILHTLDHIDDEFDILVLLQPTSPFRKASDIERALSDMSKQSAPCAVTVCESAKAPEHLFRINPDSSMTPVLGNWDKGTRRQDLPTSFALNGAVYVADIPWLRSHLTFLTAETIAVEMPPERSIDIDDSFDLVCARAYASDDIWRGIRQ